MTKPANIRTPLGIPAALMLGAAIVAGAAFATGVRAQTAAPSEPPAAAAAQKFSEQDLQSYASAVVKVQDISVKWQDKLRTTKDPAATTEIQKKAEDEAVTAVKGEGLTVEKYNRIALATETDAELRNKVLDYVSKAK
ncbi:MAG: DUF4168 domain-containing protein [Alphaproteobacteria bacterium]